MSAEIATNEAKWDYYDWALENKKISKKEYNQKTKELSKELKELRVKEEKVYKKYKAKGGKPYTQIPMDTEWSSTPWNVYKGMHRDD